MAQRTLIPLVPRPGFEAFWRAYGRRVAKADAIKAWNQLNPDAETQAAIVEALAWQFDPAVNPRWLEDGKAFAPYPGTYLRGLRWEDERPEATEAAPVKGLPAWAMAARRRA